MRHYSDPRSSNDELLKWQDDRVAQYARHIGHLERCLAIIKKQDTPQASYTRGVLTTELKRVRSILAVDRSTALAAARAEFSEKIAAWEAFAARPLPTDIEGELRRQAESALLSRALGAARAAVVLACEASCLPNLNWRDREYDALEETRDLVKAVRAHSVATIEHGYAHHALDVANAQGRAVLPEVALYYAIVEHDYRGDVEAEQIFEGRWFLASKVLGLDAKFRSVPQWERAAP